MNSIERAARFRDSLKQTQGDLAFAIVRFLIYGTIMLVGEIAFYSLIKLGREIPVVSFFLQFEWKVDPRLHLDAIWSVPGYLLFGQVSLYMFLVYGIGALFWCEFIFVRLYNRSYVLRGILYVLGFMVIEWIAGFILYSATDYKIWYYTDRLAVYEFTTFSIAGVWFCAPVMLEKLYPLLIGQRLKGKLLESLTKEIERDKETGLHNSIFWDGALSVELSRANRHKRKFSLLTISLQSALNVKHLASLLNSLVREGDVLCRTGELEFKIILHDANPNALKGFIKRLRESLSSYYVRVSGRTIATQGDRNSIALPQTRNYRQKIRKPGVLVFGRGDLDERSK